MLIKRDGGGFTLIELMVTISVLAGLLMLGFPAFTTWIKNAQVRTTAEVLQTGLRQAATEAVNRNRKVIFSFTNGTPALDATPVAGGTNWSMQTSAQFAETAAVYLGGGSLGDVASGVTMAGSPAVKSICFDSNGRLVAIAGTGVVCDQVAASVDVATAGSDRPLRVTVALGGQVRICDPNRPARSNSSSDGC